jgi:hypothetical protein
MKLILYVFVSMDPQRNAVREKKVVWSFYVTTSCIFRNFDVKGKTYLLPSLLMKAVGRTFSSAPIPTTASSSQKMPKSSSNRFFVLHYILILYRWICTIFQSISGHMKLTHLMDEDQDASIKHDEAKVTTSATDIQDKNISLQHRIGKESTVMPTDSSQNAIHARNSLNSSPIPRTISLSSIPQTFNDSSPSSPQIHKSASKQRDLSRLGEVDETIPQTPPTPQSPHTPPKQQNTSSTAKVERTPTPSIPHPLPLSYYRSKTLVLDLDETLIHSTSRGNGVPGASGRAHVIEVVVDKHACLYYVYKRPHVDYFLRKVCIRSISL